MLEQQCRVEASIKYDDRTVLKSTEKSLDALVHQLRYELMWSRFTGEEGLEPPTDYLEGSCSIQLSYSPTLAPYSNILQR
jgi:hypothetical protein